MYIYEHTYTYIHTYILTPEFWDRSHCLIYVCMNAYIAQYIPNTEKQNTHVPIQTGWLEFWDLSHCLIYTYIHSSIQPKHRKQKHTCTHTKGCSNSGIVPAVFRAGVLCVFGGTQSVAQRLCLVLSALGMLKSLLLRYVCMYVCMYEILFGTVSTRGGNQGIHVCIYV